MGKSNAFEFMWFNSSNILDFPNVRASDDQEIEQHIQVNTLFYFPFLSLALCLF